MSSKSNLAQRLNCESLESRENPDGNVAVAVSNGSIFVQGDDFANHVQIVQDRGGNLFAVGINNTTVNGQGVIFLGRFTPNNVSINGAGGNDTLQVFGVVASGTVGIAPGDEDAVAATEREIVTTGSVTVVADDPAVAADAVADLAESAGGRVESRRVQVGSERNADDLGVSGGLGRDGAVPLRRHDDGVHRGEQPSPEPAPGPHVEPRPLHVLEQSVVVGEQASRARGGERRQVGARNRILEPHDVGPPGSVDVA